MADTNLQGSGAPATPTTNIEFLQAAWEEAHEHMNACEEFACKLGDDSKSRVRRAHLDDGQKEIWQRSDLLQRLILREQPVSWRDAVILAAHVTSVGTDIEQTAEAYRADEYQSLSEGLQNLLAFIVEERPKDGVGRVLQSTINCALRAVALRTGRPEQGTTLGEAA
jgi:hypothetical protein